MTVDPETEAVIELNGQTLYIADLSGQDLLNIFMHNKDNTVGLLALQELEKRNRQLRREIIEQNKPDK